MKVTLKAWLGSLVAIGLIVFFSVQWVDRPVALWINSVVGPRPFAAGQLAQSPGLSASLISAIVFVLLGICAVAQRKFSKIEWTVLLCNISVLATEPIKNQLKFAFGRSWPDSWGPGVVSLVRDNDYGFHFFNAGVPYESFPSGHAAVVASVMLVLGAMFPRFWPIYAIFICAVDFGLVLLNLHFVSDVVAGTFVGISVGLFTVALCTPRVQSESARPSD